MIGGRFSLAVAAIVATQIFGSDPSNALTLSLETAGTTFQHTANSPCLYASGNCNKQGSFTAPTALPGSGSVTDLATAEYTVLQLRTLLKGDLFDIGFDVSFDGGPRGDPSHVLNQFYMKVGGVVTANYDPVGDALAPTGFNPGSGFSDWRLGTFSLAGLSDADKVVFYLSMSLFNDGPEQFFLIPMNSPGGGTGPVPIPGAILLMGTVLAGAGGVAQWRRRRKRIS